MGKLIDNCEGLTSKRNLRLVELRFCQVSLKLNYIQTITIQIIDPDHTCEIIVLSSILDSCAKFYI